MPAADDDSGEEYPPATCRLPPTAPPALPEDANGEDAAEIIDEESASFNKAAIACWAKMLPLLRRDKSLAGIIKTLEKLKPATLANQFLTLTYANDTPDSIVLQLNAASTLQALTRTTRIVLAREDASATVKRHLPQQDSPRRRLLSSPKILDTTREEPLVKQAISLFKGELIDARQIEPQG